MSFPKWAKLLPFCILEKLARSANKNIVWIKFFDGWDYEDNAEYKEVKADMAVWFLDGICIFISEKYDLEKRAQELEEKLACVKGRLEK